jgi:hypothetical protein
MAPGTNKEKDRAPSPTGSIISLMVDRKDDKDPYPKIQVPDLFYGDRKKFKAYYI